MLAKLDGAAFQDREAASRALVALADAAGPRLVESLRGAPTLEFKRRAEDVLDRIEASRLRSERAIEVLELIGDAAALNLLRELGRGMPGAAQTRDAAAALARASKMN